MKRIFSLIVILAFTVVFVQPQNITPKPSKISSKKIPKEVVIVVKFLDLPGKKNPKSKWEVSYELRIIDTKSSYEATIAGKLKSMEISGEKVGDLIKKGSFKKENLFQTANREFILKIPLDEKMQEKLKNSESLQQEFLFYGSALVYDGKLKKNIIVPLSWVWRYEIYPDAKFGMEFKVQESEEENGYSYSTNTFLPEKLPKGYFTTSAPQ